MSTRVGAGAAPIPERPPVQEPPPSTGKETPPGAPKAGDNTPPRSTAESREASSTPQEGFELFSESSQGQEGGLLGEALTQQEQMLKDLGNLARANINVLTSSDVTRAGQTMAGSEGTHQTLTQTQSDSARQAAHDLAGHHTLTRSTFEQGGVATDSAARRAAEGQKALESGVRHTAAKTDAEKGGQADRAGDSAAKRAGGSAEERLRAGTTPKPEVVEKHCKQTLPNYKKLDGGQQQVVREHVGKLMQMQKLQQMLDKAKEQGDTEKQKFLESLLGKLKEETKNPPEELAIAQGAEEAGKAEEGKETEGADKTEGEQTEEGRKADSAERIGEQAQTDSGAGGQEGGAMDQGAQLPAVLPPTVDTNLSLMQTLERRDDVFTVGGTGASPEAQRSEQLGRMGARQMAVMGMGAGETYRLHGSNGFQAIRMRYHGGGHSLDPQYQDEVGQANVEQGGVRMVGHRSGVTANIYQLGGALKGVDSGQKYINYRGQQWSAEGIRREMNAAAMVRGFHAASVTPGRTQSLGSYNVGMMA